MRKCIFKEIFSVLSNSSGDHVRVSVIGSGKNIFMKLAYFTANFTVFPSESNAESIISTKWKYLLMDLV